MWAPERHLYLRDVEIHAQFCLFACVSLYGAKMRYIPKLNLLDTLRTSGKKLVAFSSPRLTREEYLLRVMVYRGNDVEERAAATADRRRSS